jgi:hypothetical protein
MNSLRMYAAATAIAALIIPAMASGATKKAVGTESSTGPCNGGGWGVQCECVPDPTGEGQICDFHGKVSSQDHKLLLGIARRSQAKSPPTIKPFQ